MFIQTVGKKIKYVYSLDPDVTLRHFIKFETKSPASLFIKNRTTKWILSRQNLQIVHIHIVSHIHLLSCVMLHPMTNNPLWQSSWGLVMECLILIWYSLHIVIALKSTQNTLSSFYFIVTVYDLKYFLRKLFYVYFVFINLFKCLENKFKMHFLFVKYERNLS